VVTFIDTFILAMVLILIYRAHQADLVFLAIP